MDILMLHDKNSTHNFKIDFITILWYLTENDQKSLNEDGTVLL